MKEFTMSVVKCDQQYYSLWILVTGNRPLIIQNVQISMVFVLEHLRSEASEETTTTKCTHSLYDDRFQTHTEASNIHTHTLKERDICSMSNEISY